MRGTDTCWHLCPLCNRDWSHEVAADSLKLDKWRAPCPDCSAEVVAVPTAEDSVAREVLQLAEPAPELSEPEVQQLEPSDDIAVTLEDEEDDARIVRHCEETHAVLVAAENFDD